MIDHESRGRTMRIWKARFSSSEVWDLRILDLRKILQSKNLECNDLGLRDVRFYNLGYEVY